MNLHLSINSSILLFSLVSLTTSCQNKPIHPDSLQYPVGYPKPAHSALQQLESYPLPRYSPGNHLQRLFNWADPNYMGGYGQAGINSGNARNNGINIQKELALDWNYGIVIPNASVLFNYLPDTATPPIILLANEYPHVPLDVITFWSQLSPSDIGYHYGKPMIDRRDLDSSFYITFNFYGETKKEIKYNFPDSLIKIDGKTQEYYLSRILKKLKRPLNRINENGEEPPGAYLRDYQLADDPQMVHMKDSMKIESWVDFAATCKLRMRNLYSDCFMKDLPGLKNTFYSVYTVEGGPIDRFKWSILKKCMTPLNGIYYSTPDFYPRWPHNWKDWQGAWHGWKWIETGRQVEIKNGDYLFSPFVAAGWSHTCTENIRPAQWLGLLKCLSVIGAEFYYVGYFNLSAPFSDPAEYVWQMAMPAYSQAITSRFEDVLRNGNVLFDSDGKPIISYPVSDKHILITARKHNTKEKYVICGTYQPFTNDSNEIPAKKIVSVTIDGNHLSFEVRRQGSVYIYERVGAGFIPAQNPSGKRTIFYQLDSWHENAHPEYWSKDFCVEAEVADSGLDENDIYTTANGDAGDYTNYVSYIHPEINKKYCYDYTIRDSSASMRYIWIRYKGKGALQLNFSGNSEPATCPLSNDWKWIKFQVPDGKGYTRLRISESEGNIDIDKFVITTKGDGHP